MKPAAFDYYRAETLREALELRAEKRDALRIIAGGQSLGAMLNLRLVSPEGLLDISRLDELKQIEVRDGRVEVGARADLVLVDTAETPTVTRAFVEGRDVYRAEGDR